MRAPGWAGIGHGRKRGLDYAGVRNGEKNLDCFFGFFFSPKSGTDLEWETPGLNFSRIQNGSRMGENLGWIFQKYRMRENPEWIFPEYGMGENQWDLIPVFCTEIHSRNHTRVPKPRKANFFSSAHYDLFYMQRHPVIRSPTLKAVDALFEAIWRLEGP